MRHLILFLVMILSACGGSGAQDDLVQEPARKPQLDNTNGSSSNTSNAFVIGPLPDGYSNWEEIDQVNPEERAMMILDGEDPIGGSCSIYLMGTTIGPDGTVQFVVRSTFGHGDDGHKLFVTQQPVGLAVRSIGKNMDEPGQIALEFSGGSSFKRVITVNIKWWHIDHFDIDRCTKLQPRQSGDSSASRGLVLPDGINELAEIDDTNREVFHLKKYLGFDPVKRAFGEEDSCYLYVMAIDYQQTHISYYLRTSFDHNGASHPAFEVRWLDNADQSGLLEGNHQKDPDSFLRLKFADNDPIKSDEVTVKWLHLDHYHIDQCRGLKLQP